MEFDCWLDDPSLFKVVVLGFLEEKVMCSSELIISQSISEFTVFSTLASNSLDAFSIAEMLLALDDTVRNLPNLSSTSHFGYISLKNILSSFFFLFVSGIKLVTFLKLILNNISSVVHCPKDDMVCKGYIQLKLYRNHQCDDGLENPYMILVVYLLLELK